MPPRYQPTDEPDKPEARSSGGRAKRLAGAVLALGAVLFLTRTRARARRQ